MIEYQGEWYSKDFGKTFKDHFDVRLVANMDFCGAKNMMPLALMILPFGCLKKNKKSIVDKVYPLLDQYTLHRGIRSCSKILRYFFDSGSITQIYRLTSRQSPNP